MLKMIINIATLAMSLSHLEVIVNMTSVGGKNWKVKEKATRVNAHARLLTSRMQV